MPILTSCLPTFCFSLVNQSISIPGGDSTNAQLRRAQASWMDEDIHQWLKIYVYFPYQSVSSTSVAREAGLLWWVCRVHVLSYMIYSTDCGTEQSAPELVRYSLSSGRNSIASTYRCALRDETRFMSDSHGSGLCFRVTYNFTPHVVVPGLASRAG